MPSSEQRTASRLRRVMRFGDLLLFYVVTGFSLRWIAPAAAAGPSAIVVWIGAALVFYAPLVLSVLELSSRYPEEGGMYVWSKRAFGPFAGFITGWTYWACNLPYYPALLYFAAGNALFVGGTHWQHLAADRTYYVVFALAGLALAAGLNVRGLDVGKWLHNAGAVANWVPATLLLLLGAAAAVRFGAATDFGHGALVPSTHIKDIIFWSTIAFAMSGVEGASLLGEEIEDARRSIPRAALAAGALVTAMYVLSTAALLVALPQRHITSIQGFTQAVAAASWRLGAGAVVAPAAALVVLGAVGQAGAWFAATARLPFVAGLDRFLPPAFGRLHPRWASPYVALLVQAAIAAVFIFLGQAGTSVKGAYDVLVSMTIITYFIPYLLMFASLIRVQRMPAPPGTIRIAGGAPAAVLVGTVGFLSTALSIVLACVPPPDEPNKPLAVTKVVGLSALLVAIGVGLYAAGALRRAAVRHA